jgi:hypothetical protein
MKYDLVIRDFFEHFDPGCPYHCASMMELQEAINKADPSILKSDADWFRTWSISGKRGEETTRGEYIHPWYKHTK